MSQEIGLNENAKIFEKTKFSMITEEIENMLNPGTTSRHSQVPQNAVLIVYCLVCFNLILLLSHHIMKSSYFLFLFVLPFEFVIASIFSMQISFHLLPLLHLLPEFLSSLVFAFFFFNSFCRLFYVVLRHIFVFYRQL